MTWYDPPLSRRYTSFGLACQEYSMVSINLHRIMLPPLAYKVFEPAPAVGTYVFSDRLRIEEPIQNIRFRIQCAIALFVSFQKLKLDSIKKPHFWKANGDRCSRISFPPRKSASACSRKTFAVKPFSWNENLSARMPRVSNRHHTHFSRSSNSASSFSQCSAAFEKTTCSPTFTVFNQARNSSQK